MQTSSFYKNANAFQVEKIAWADRKRNKVRRVFGTGTKVVLGHWCICCVLISGRINKVPRQVRFTDSQHADSVPNQWVSFIISEPCAIKSVHPKPNAFKIWSQAWGYFEKRSTVTCYNKSNWIPLQEFIPGHTLGPNPTHFSHSRDFIVKGIPGYEDLYGLI